MNKLLYFILGFIDNKKYSLLYDEKKEIIDLIPTKSIDELDKCDVFDRIEVSRNNYSIVASVVDYLNREEILSYINRIKETYIAYIMKKSGYVMLYINKNEAKKIIKYKDKYFLSFTEITIKKEPILIEDDRLKEYLNKNSNLNSINDYIEKAHLSIILDVDRRIIIKMHVIR